MKYTDSFEQFWKLYPGRTSKVGRIIKQDKLGASVEWRKMTQTERLLAMFSHPEQGQYTPDARKWLKHKRWEDEDTGCTTCTVKTKLYPIKGKTCGRSGCRMPAVYRDISGNYDNYACAEHMPDKVKALYM